MSKFKVGDKVRRTVLSFGKAIKGETYTVASTTGTDWAIQLEGCGSVDYDPSFFELAVEEPKTKPHKHAAIIKAWADGAAVQVRGCPQSKWHDTNATPAWSIDLEYRVKPEPKPDVVKYGVAKLLDNDTGAVYYLGERNTTIGQNLCLTFDGETRQLKSASVINKD